MHRVQCLSLLGLVGLVGLSPAVVHASKTLQIQVSAGPIKRLDLFAKGRSSERVLELGYALQVESGPLHTGKISLPYGEAADRLRSGLVRVRNGAQKLRTKKGQTTESRPSLAFNLPSSLGPIGRPSLRDGLTTYFTSAGAIPSWAGPPLHYRLSFERVPPYRDARWGALGTVDVFHQVLANEWHRVGYFVQRKGLVCRGNHLLEGELELLAVSPEQMNVPWRVEEARRLFERDFYELWGFYLPNEIKRGDSTIAVSARGLEATTRLLGHELAHHAYSACQLKKQWRGDTESFAQAFERESYAW